jgi:tetratricopeptide (TPR) repeat protein
MARAAPNVGLFLLLALPALAAPALKGSFYGDLGVLDFDTRPGGRVAAHFERGGACNFDPDRRIVYGEMQGDVLVGSVTLCQVGAACHERVYPFMGFYNAQDGTLSANIRLEASCDSPALKGKRLVLRRGTPEEAEGNEVPVRKHGNAKHAEDVAKKSFQAGWKALQNLDFVQASKQFELSLSYNDGNADAYQGLGVAEAGLRHYERALTAYGQSLELKPDSADVYYDAACAYACLGQKEEAMANLHKAVKNGFEDASYMKGDKDLKPLLGDDPDFRQLVDQAAAQKAQHQRGARRGEGKH